MYLSIYLYMYISTYILIYRQIGWLQTSTSFSNNIMTGAWLCVLTSKNLMLQRGFHLCKLNLTSISFLLYFSPFSGFFSCLTTGIVIEKATWQKKEKRSHVLIGEKQREGTGKKENENSHPHILVHSVNTQSGWNWPVTGARNQKHTPGL